MSNRTFLNLDPKILVLGILVLTMLIPVAIWSLQGTQMRDDFVRALRSGSASLPVDLRGKKWTEPELAGVEVLRVPGGSGRERALSREIHDRGRVVVAPQQYQYQGTVKDESTGIVHVFGLPRQGPATWQWISVHMSSLDLHMDRRVQQLEDMKKRSEAEGRRPVEAGARSPTIP